jgi:hypothetical protein
MKIANGAARNLDRERIAARASSKNIVNPQADDDRTPVGQLALRLEADSLSELIAPLRDRLQALLGFIEIAAGESNGELKRDRRRLLERVRLGLHGLDHSVSNLVEAAFAVAGSDYVSPQAFALGDLAPELEPTLRYLCSRKCVALNLDVRHSDVILVCDWRRLRSIVLNLALTAVEHLTDGELTVQIRLTGRSKDLLDGKVREPADLELRLLGRTRGRARPRGEEKAFAEKFGRNFKLGFEPSLSATLAHYHLLAMGGTIHVKEARAAACALAARIPVNIMTASRARMLTSRPGMP